MLIEGVLLRAIRLFIGNHAEDNLEQALAQAAQCASVAFSLFPFFSIIDLPPRAGFAKAIGPEMNRVAEEFVAGFAKSYLVDLARLKADWGRSRKTLQHSHVRGVSIGI